MIEGLLGAPIPCDPAARVTLPYFIYGTRVKMEIGQVADAQSKFGDLVPPPAGTWFWRNPGESPFIACPRCGNAGRLENHSVNSKGEVNPSIVCPMSNCGDGEARCDAHYYGKLDGYMFIEAGY